MSILERIRGIIPGEPRADRADTLAKIEAAKAMIAEAEALLFVDEPVAPRRRVDRTKHPIWKEIETVQHQETIRRAREAGEWTDAKLNGRKPNPLQEETTMLFRLKSDMRLKIGNAEWKLGCLEQDDVDGHPATEAELKIFRERLADLKAQFERERFDRKADDFAFNLQRNGWTDTMIKIAYWTSGDVERETGALARNYIHMIR